MGLCLIVHQGGVLLEEPVILPADGLLEQMESAAEIHIYLLEKGRYKVILEGKNLGALIGRRGETLDAIQQLTSYAVNRSGSGRVRVQLDAENYRARC